MLMISGEKIIDLLKTDRLLTSVEFFPPKDEAGGARILETADKLRESVGPDFVSITYGAGGTTRDRTWRYALALKNEHGFEVMPHLTCVGSSRDTLREILSAYQDAGFHNIMALRGDPPKGDKDFVPHPDGFAHANELVAFIRQEFPDFCIGVAGYPEVHPEATSALDDLTHLKRKVEAGAAFITTQLFYDTGAFIKWYDTCRASGITVPIIPGLMPIRSAEQARRFCKSLPNVLEVALAEAGPDKEAVAQIGVDWTVRQICDLIDHGLNAVHLYIMNQSGSALGVIEGLRKRGRL
jgi:methylenetetrahydrofolate reductase (NADPH)